MPRRMRMKTPNPEVSKTDEQATTVSAENPLRLTNSQLARLLGISDPNILDGVKNERILYYLFQSGNQYADKEFRLTLSAALVIDTKEQCSLMAALGNYLVARSMYERTLIDQLTYHDLKRNFVVALKRVRGIPLFQPLLEAIHTDYASYVGDIFLEVMGNG